MKTSELKNELLMYRLRADGVNASYSHAEILRKAESTLRNWYTLECGTEHGHIEQDETTGQWYSVSDRRRVVDLENYNRTPIADRESGAIKRIEAVCAEIGCHYYIQGDPRGASLYVSSSPIDNNGNRGVCCDLG